MSTEENTQKFLNLTGRLSQLVKRENELLKTPGRTVGLKELLVEKQALSTAYEQQIEYFSDQTVVDEMDPVERSRLKEAITALTAMMDENKRRLESKIEAARLVFQIIANAAKEHQLQNLGVYGSSGDRSKNARQAYRPAVSVGLNQEF
ncbi:MAG: hypothetical protein CMM10_16440 [Rhodospirillaceae bacterium]|jgi:hypothetical protein|nr:hypothetical protein [Rhodospirillaceae bacterium]|tara:strand:- start:2093 stop:2539 length:447 start_codon:yes stop_codon:yes gene_type:complete